MKVKPGYKQTEVGVLPEEWQVKRIDQVADANWGNTAITKDAYREAGYPAYSASGLDGFVSWFDHDKPAVILSAIGAQCGKTWFATDKWTAIKNTIWIRGEDGEATSEFIYRVTGNPSFWPNRGQAQPFIALGDVRAAKIPVPPLPEQRAIAAALSDMDELLGGLDRLIAKKRDLKQAVMQQLLTGQTRLPGFGVTRSFVSDELGTRPQDWDMVPLNELVDPSRGIRYGIVQPGAYDPNGRFMIRAQDYSEAKGWADPSDVFRVSDTIEQRYRSARVQHGDLIMTIVGYCGHVEIVPAWLDGANLTQTTARIAIQSGRASPQFCKYMLQSAVGRSQVASFLKGAAQPGLNCGDVEKFRLPLPKMREQTAIAAGLSDMDAELAALEARRDKTRDLKQAMMQELLTGRTRLL